MNFLMRLPIKQFIKINKKWQERYVDITNKKNLNL